MLKEFTKLDEFIVLLIAFWLMIIDWSKSFCCFTGSGEMSLSIANWSSNLFSTLICKFVGCILTVLSAIGAWYYKLAPSYT